MCHHVVGAAVDVLLDVEEYPVNGDRVAPVADDRVHRVDEDLRLAGAEVRVAALHSSEALEVVHLVPIAQPGRVWVRDDSDLIGAGL
jgi:hypothetical protein